MSAPTAVAGIGDGVPLTNRGHRSTPLNEAMSFGHVVWSDGCGNVYQRFTGPQPDGPETVYLILDDDGQSLDDDYQDVPDGWEPLTGFTRQDPYHGPTMHTSEFIGGRMERHIRDNAGYYAAVVVDGLYNRPEAGHPDEDMTMGWAVFHRDAAT